MSNSLQRGDNNSIQEQETHRFIPSFAFEETKTNGLDPQTVIGILLRYKWIILLFLTIGAAGALIYANTVTPVYESKGLLLISSNAAFPDDELSQIISKTTGYGTNSTFENELQVLRSRTFSLEIAQKLIEEDPGFIQKFPLLWTQEETGEIRKAEAETVASRIRNGMNFRQPEEDSDVVEVTFQSTSPLEAATVVNHAMKIYVNNSLQQNRQAAKLTASFLANERQKLKQKLEAAEERLRQFMDSTGIVQVDEQASGMVNRREEINAELQSVNLELETISQTIANYEEQLEKIKPGLSEQLSEAIGPRIRNAQENLAAFESERTLIIAKNPDVLERRPIPPRLKFVNEQINHLKEEIKNLSNKLFTNDDKFMGMDGEDRAELVADIQNRLVELRIQQSQYRSRRTALLQHKEKIKVDFNGLPEGMIQLAKLQRNVRINEDLYLNVARQHADMSVWKETQFGFGRIIDTGEISKVPVSPNKTILLFLGLMLGGVFSAGFITIREFRDDSVKNVDQLRTQHLPMLSVVPTFETSLPQKSFSVGEGQIPEEMVLLHDRSSLAAESIRKLKNNLIYQKGDHPPKTIAVTSPEKGDGKSTIVANLGVAFAEEGYKTLIIGADFHRPKLQKYFGLTGKEGLSDYLSGDVTFQQLLMLIQNTDLPALKVVTAGKHMQRPDVIGSNDVFKKFLKKMGDVFDIVLLDTPPFGIISDSTALIKDAEATLVVARYRKTNKQMLLRTIEELERIKANVTDVVLNDFDHRKETGSYYGSSYYQTLYGNYEAYSS